MQRGVPIPVSHRKIGTSIHQLVQGFDAPVAHGGKKYSIVTCSLASGSGVDQTWERA